MSAFVPSTTRYRGLYGTRFGGRSGLTPLDAIFPTNLRGTGATPNHAQDAQINAFQRRDLVGFTTRELVELDAITLRNLKPFDLANPILPLIDRNCWETLTTIKSLAARKGFYPIGNGIPGNYDVANSQVWNAIYPSLAIASRMLMNFHMLPWFDSLLHGDLFPVDADRRPSPPPDAQGWPTALKTLHRRTARMGTLNLQNTQTATDRDKIFEFMSRDMDLQLGFRIDKEDPETAKKVSYTQHGYTTWAPRPVDENNGMGTLRIYIDTSNVYPLLRPDISDAERFNGQWFIANTILHEMIHAVWFARCNTDSMLRSHMISAYFEDEPMAEMGLSMENTVYGGLPEIMGEGGFHNDDLWGPKPHVGLWLMRPFPSRFWRDVLDPGMPVLKYPDPPNLRESFPYKVTFIEDMHQEAFWGCAVVAYGLQVFHSRSSPVGARQAFNRDGIINQEDRNKISKFTDFTQSLVEPTPQEYSLLTPQERCSWDYAKFLLRSAKFEQEYYDSTAEIRKTVEKIVGEVTQTGANTVQWETDRKMFSAAQYHLDAMKALFVSEAETNTFYPDRRENLLRWNAGARAFMRMMLGPSEGNAAMNIEFVRMSLTDPQIASTESPELQAIEAAHQLFLAGNQSECLATCISILNAPTCSLFGRAAACILVARLNTRDKTTGKKGPNTPDGRALNLHTGQLLMKKLKNNCPAAWKDAVDNFLAMSDTIQPEIQADWEALPQKQSMLRCDS